MKDSIKSLNSLNSLHLAFSQTDHGIWLYPALRYIGKDKLDPNKWIPTQKKHLFLQEIFKQAAHQVESVGIGSSLESLKKRTILLLNLKNDGEALFSRYKKSTSTWKRRFLKWLPLILPKILKKVFPACFSNKMKEAEAATLNEYVKFDARITKKITELDSAQKKFEPLNNPANNKDPIPLKDPKIPQKITPLENPKPCNAHLLSDIESSLKSIHQFGLLPFSLAKLRGEFLKMTHAAIDFVKANSEDKVSLEKLGIHQKEMDVINQPEWKEALTKKDDAKICDLLKPFKKDQKTPSSDDPTLSKLPQLSDWYDAFYEASQQKGTFSLRAQKILGQTDLIIKDENQKKLQESALKNYRGQLQAFLGDANSLDVIKKLGALLEANVDFRPHTLVIELSNKSLNEDLFKQLLILKKYVGEIKINDLEDIDFKKLGTDKNEELEFIQHLNSFHFPLLKHFIFSDHSKESWKVDNYSSVLSICPTMEVLKNCYLNCPEFKNILIPLSLINQPKFDARQYTVEHTEHLLTHFFSLTSLDLSGLPIKDDSLKQWLNLPSVGKLNSLQLKGCHALTTDILHTFTTLPQISQLHLPDLPQGNIALDQLPKLDNPFLIKSLYTTSKLTQPFASQLYTGPKHWSALFQIPLAKAGESQIFHSSQTSLDPKSVSYWIHNENYKHLSNAKSNHIETVLAEQNEELTDDHLVNFMKNFPKANMLSLYQCPNITSTGIVDMLKACPNIKILDLTDCPKIKHDLFVGDGNFQCLSKLKKIILTGTSISKNLSKLFEDQGLSIEFAENSLNVANADLLVDNGLEKILKKMDLTTLTHIDLSDSTLLTDKMLGDLLELLNAPNVIQKNGNEINNSQHLNMATLNLENCHQITDEAFKAKSNPKSNVQDPDKQKKPNLKYLGTLERVVTGGTKISEKLKASYPQISFQTSNKPATLKIDPTLQFENCLEYHSQKAKPNSNDQNLNDKQLSRHYMHNRIVSELFHNEIDPAKISSFSDLPSIDPLSEEFKEILYFKTADQSKKVLKYAIYREQLYSLPASYFRKRMREGGEMKKECETTFVNQHATDKAVQAVIDLFEGKLSIDKLDIATAGHVAELIGPQIFNFEETYASVLDHLYKQFNLQKAADLFEIAILLNDKKGKDHYENALINQLNDQSHLPTFYNLSNSYNLPKLKIALVNEETLRLKKKPVNPNPSPLPHFDPNYLKNLLNQSF